MAAAAAGSAVVTFKSTGMAAISGSSVDRRVANFRHCSSVSGRVGSSQLRELRLAFIADRGARLLLLVSAFIRSFQLLFLRSFYMQLVLVFVFSLWMLVI